MPRYADVDRLMEHAIKLDWSSLKWVNEVDIYTSINPRVAERKKGKWIWMGDKGDSRFMCSVCKWKEEVPTCMGVPNIWEYCPSCGAYMREESDDERISF